MIMVPFRRPTVEPWTSLTRSHIVGTGSQSQLVRISKQDTFLTNNHLGKNNLVALRHV